MLTRDVNSIINAADTVKLKTLTKSYCTFNVDNRIIKLWFYKTTLKSSQVLKFIETLSSKTEKSLELGESLIQDLNAMRVEARYAMPTRSFALIIGSKRVMIISLRRADCFAATLASNTEPASQEDLMAAYTPPS